MPLAPLIFRASYRLTPFHLMSKFSNLTFALLFCPMLTGYAEKDFSVPASVDVALSKTMDAYHSLAIKNSVDLIQEHLFQPSDSRGAWHSIERHVFQHFQHVEEVAVSSVPRDENKYLIVAVRCTDEKGQSLVINEHWLKVADNVWRLVPLEMTVPECPGKKRYGLKKVELVWNAENQPCKSFRWSTTLSSGVRLGGMWHHKDEKPDGQLPRIMTIQIDSLVRAGVYGPEKVVAAVWQSKVSMRDGRRALVETHFLIVESLAE